MFAGTPVVGDLDALDNIDVILITDVVSPQTTYERLIEALPEERVLVLPLLRIVPPAVED